MLAKKYAVNQGIKELTIDADAQTVSINLPVALSLRWFCSDFDTLNCRVEYFSQRLVMLAYHRPADYYFGYRLLRRYQRLPIFSTMLSTEDFSRLLAVARVVRTR